MRRIGPLIALIDDAWGRNYPHPMRRWRWMGVGGAAVALLFACATSQTSAPVAVAIPLDAGIRAVESGAGAAGPTDAGNNDPGKVLSFPNAHGCIDLDASSARPPAPATKCIVRGKNALVLGVLVPLEDGSLMRVGLYGGGAELEAAKTEGARTRVKLTDPLEVEGFVEYDRSHIGLVHTKGGSVHPTLKLMPNAPLAGVADGDHFRARALFGGYFAIGTFDVPCDAVGLGDWHDIFDTTYEKTEKNALTKPKGPELQADPKHPEKIAPNPRTGTINASWRNGDPLLKANIDSTDGLRLIAAFGEDGFSNSSLFEVIDRKAEHLRIRSRTVGGSELTAWVEASQLEVQNGGRGEGIGLCGCGRPGHGWTNKMMTLVRGAKVYTRPDGPAWAKAPKDVELSIENEPAGEWRKIFELDRIAEGGDPCSTYRIEHGWVRASDLRWSR